MFSIKDDKYLLKLMQTVLKVFIIFLMMRGTETKTRSGSSSSSSSSTKSSSKILSGTSTWTYSRYATQRGTNEPDYYFIYVACYNTEDLQFSEDIGTSYEPSSCLDECTNYDYFGLQNAGECLCGNGYETMGNGNATVPLDDNACGDDCTSDTTSCDGGSNTVAIYEVGYDAEGSTAPELASFSATLVFGISVLAMIIMI
mmetsp:Transcript_21906/g.28698  ORF Transcript_21906/g.28698 Transcript_21906/m.28698 type:complete len:200 (+) Transcript_21906:253-852(+)